MTKEEFKNYLKHIRLINDIIDKLNSLGIDIGDSDFMDSIFNLMDMPIRLLYNEKCADIFFWYLYEDVDHTIYDKEGNILVELNSDGALYDYLETINN